MSKRIPIKKNSIEKKNKIIEKGFELICNKGFNNVTCVDIAKYADVSTGIIYQYFDNKKDIFIEGINNYCNRIFFPIKEILLDELKTDEDISFIIENIIDKFIENYKRYKNYHNEILSLSWNDIDIFNIINENEIKMIDDIYDLLNNYGFNVINLKEKISIIYRAIDSYSHEVIGNKKKNINDLYMKKEIIRLSRFLLENY